MVLKKTLAASPPDKSFVERSLRRLAGAVLLQALDELGRGPGKYRDQAQRWMSGQGESAFSFELCCSLLGFRPRYVQDKLTARQLRNFREALSETAFGDFLRDS